MPRQLFFVGPDKLEWREYKEPPLSPGQVRIKSEFAAAKHGTELAMCKGYAGARGSFDRTLGLFAGTPAGQAPIVGDVVVGNMVVGPVVEAAGDVKGLKVGDRVLSYGGFAQSHAVSAGGCWKIPASLGWKSAVCLDPADFAMAAVRDGHVRIGDNVAVFGLGAIGLMAVQLCRLSGAAAIIGVDPLAERRAAAQKMGATLTLDPKSSDAGLEIKRATGNRGADVVIEYSGSRQAMQAALRGVAYGGNVVAGAFPPPYETGLDFGAEAHLNIPNIIFSRACSQPDRDHPRWNERRIQDTLVQLFTDGRLSGEDVVNPVATPDTLADEYYKVFNGASNSIKLGLKW